MSPPEDREPAPDPSEIQFVDPEFEPAFHRILGIRVGIGPERSGVAYLKVDPERHYGNRWVHGGIVAPLVDIASGVAIALSVPNPMRAIDGTVEMKINYLRKVYDGDVIATARLMHLGKRLAVTDVDVTNNGSLIAKAVATFMLNRAAVETAEPGGGEP